MIHNKVERFEFATKVIFGYEQYRNGTGKQRTQNFIQLCWQDYQEEFEGEHFPLVILKSRHTYTVHRFRDSPEVSDEEVETT